MSKKLLQAFEALEEDKGIKKEIIIEALEAALISAYKRHYGQAQNVMVEFNDKKGDIKVFAVKEVVETSLDDTQEISLKDALEINRAYEIGDKIKFEVTPKNFGRIAAQTAKQVIIQRMREAERSMIYEEYIGYEDELLSAVVDRVDHRFVLVNLGRIQAAIMKSDQIQSEEYSVGKRLKVYVSKVDNTTKGPQVLVSRTHPNLLKRLFEQEVPEIYDGVVEIMSVAREAGDRSKLAVRSYDANIDPVGTCVGPKGQRVQVIVDELNGENMDIIEWHEDPAEYIKQALKPAEVLDVIFNENDSQSCVVVVPDTQLSLAIGKRGQNARLAAKLTGYRIDIKSEKDWESMQHPELASEVTEEVIAVEPEQLSDEMDLVDSIDQPTFDEETVEEALVEEGLSDVTYSLEPETGLLD
ncbi:transcription termination factor NusA [Atopobacter phocae]|uniref:transcription termination factor NusA n=1 Tax=Atopobacter phocae TaxID=136492 RepID=UPI00046EDED1|nr:transcription termination factor NusA [Atopobacter phocae]